MEEKAAELVVEMEGGAKEEGRVAAKAPAAMAEGRGAWAATAVMKGAATAEVGEAVRICLAFLRR